MRLKVSVTIIVAVCMGCLIGMTEVRAAQGTKSLLVSADPAAVSEVLAAKRKDANAAWWGFSEEDSTEALQAAINSKAEKLTVPNMGKPWIVRQTIMLKSNQEIIFEKGVSILAKEGAFTGIDDSLVRAVDMTNITLRGYGAEFVMRKEDYRKPPYKKAEWRHCLALIACANVEIYGLRLASSGGDGLYIGSRVGDPNIVRLPNPLKGCKDILVKDIDCDSNYRQGISVISAQNLLIENCTLQNTGGAAPGAGIDFEPNDEDEFLVNCIVRDCVMKGNMGGKWGGDGILIVGPKLMQPISIRIENCTSENNKRTSVTIVPRGATGQIDFVNCTLKGKIDAPKRDDLKVRFLDEGAGPTHKPDMK